MRQRRWSVAGATAVAAALALSGCSGYQPAQAQRHGGKLVVALYAPPVSFNPLVAGDLNSVRAYTPLFPHLYSAAADLSVTPDLAASLPVESAEGTVWTIPLRASARWSDGQPITADDVVYTIATESDPTLDSQATFDWSEVHAISATSAHTVQITLTKPDASFLGDHLTAAIVPKHVLSQNHPAQMSQAIYNHQPTVTGGPFLFTAAESILHYTLSANRGYYLGAPNLDSIEEVVVANPDDLGPALGQGQVLFAPGLTAAQAAEARSDDGVGVFSYPALGYYGVQFNERRGHPFADAVTRHALDLSLDRSSIVARATSGQGLVLWGDINPRSWAFNAAAIAPHGRDVTAARALLTGAGWTVPPAGAATRSGLTLDVRLIYPRSDPARARAAQDIAGAANAAGVVLTPWPLADTDFGTALQSGAFDAALTAGGLGVDPDDSLTVACDQAPPQDSAGLNAGGFCDPALDALLTAEQTIAVTSKTAMEQQRRPIFDSIQRRFTADLPFIPMWTDTRWMAINSTVGGVGSAGAQLDQDLNSAFYGAWYLTG